MTNRNTILMLLCLASFAVYGQSAEDLRRLKQFQEQVNKPVVYHAEGMEKVLSVKDIVFNKNLFKGKMDIYTPQLAKSEKRPLILVIHGKTPITTNPKNWGVYESWGKILAAEGYVTSIFTNSLAVPGTPLENAGNDLKDALSFVKSNAARYNIDTARIAIMGFSAGVPVVCAALGKTSPKCIVTFYGFMDANMASMFKTESQETLNKYSMKTYADSSHHFPPIFIGRAGLDSNVGLNNSIDAFVQKASENNLTYTLANHAKGVHGFDNQNDDKRTKEIIEEMIIFLKYNLK